MPRLRGPITEKPTGKKAWPLLNRLIFGDNALGGHYAAIKADDLPLDWTEIFGRSAPMSLEIGFNRGRFLSALAEEYPHQDFVGIEVRRRYCWLLANVLGDRLPEPNNLRIIWADAKAVTRHIFGREVLDNIYVTFPDPWWKNRHAKRRLVDTHFAEELAGLLKPGGRVWVKSDVPAIADEIADSLAGVKTLGAREPFSESELPLTHRETKCIAEGLPIIRFVVRRMTSD